MIRLPPLPFLRGGGVGRQFHLVVGRCPRSRERPWTRYESRPLSKEGERPWSTTTDNGLSLSEAVGTVGAVSSSLYAESKSLQTKVTKGFRVRPYNGPTQPSGPYNRPGCTEGRV